jgi:hypothetical protein
MIENQPPRLYKNTHLPTDCAVAQITPGANAVISVGELHEERLYAVTKPSSSPTPTGPRCRFALLERIRNAGIRDVRFTSPCSLCKARVEEITPQED